MASVEKSKLSTEEYNFLCCAYASLILSDDGKAVSEDTLKKILGASSNKVNAEFVKLFAKSMEGQDVKEILKVMTAAPVAAPAAAAPAAKKTEEKKKPKEEKKEEENEEVNMEGMGGMFGDDE